MAQDAHVTTGVNHVPNQAVQFRNTLAPLEGGNLRPADGPLHWGPELSTLMDRPAETSWRDEAARYFGPRGVSLRYPLADSLADDAVYMPPQVSPARRLRESDERYRVLFELTRDGAVETDAVTGRFIRANDAFRRMTGYSADELMSMRFSDLAPAEDRDEVVRQIRAMAAEAASVARAEVRLVRRDGEALNVLLDLHVTRGSDGKPLRTVALIRDVTETWSEANMLRSALQSTIDALPTQIMILDATGAILSVNQACRRFADEIGVQGPDGFIGCGHLVWLAAVAPDSVVTHVAEGLLAVLRGEREEFRDIYNWPGAGDERSFQMRIRRFTTSEGIRVVVTQEDVTEVKRAEQWPPELSSRLMRAQEEERRRIARDLHDVTAQDIFSISMNLSRIPGLLSGRKSDPAKTAEARVLLEESVSTCDRSLKDIRTLSYLLHPPLLEEAGLCTALQWFANGFAHRSGIHVDMVASPGIERFPVEVETALYRVAQECLTNIHRHSGSQTASIRLAEEGNKVSLRIRDCGCGLGPGSQTEACPNGSAAGVGIPGMRQRLLQLGGALEIESSARGTTVTATVPAIWLKSGG
jgi:two-component system NarL family sensor kinase